jgi:hypothetical protein
MIQIDRSFLKFWWIYAEIDIFKKADFCEICEENLVNLKKQTWCDSCEESFNESEMR